MTRQLERLLADQPLQCGGPRLVRLHQVSRPGSRGEGAGLVFVDPDTDHVASDVVALGQTVERLAGQALLSHLTFEGDTVGSVLRHGFNPSNARYPGQSRSADLSGPTGPLHAKVPL